MMTRLLAAGTLACLVPSEPVMLALLACVLVLTRWPHLVVRGPR